MNRWLPVLIAIGGGALLFASKHDPAPKPTAADEVGTAFATEQRLYRVAIEGAVQRLTSGELTTDTQARDWLKAAVDAAHREAWLPVANKDAAAFADGWTTEKHAARLRSMSQ